MLAKICKPFTTHPAAVGESYLQHLGFAAWFGGMLAMAAGAAFIHAILPFACERTASRIVGQLAARTQGRGPA